MAKTINAPAITPSYVVDACTTLKNNWSVRAKKFNDWYDILLLNDELAQPGMESVVTNDPRTGYNLAKHLLSGMVIADKIESVELPQENIAAVSYLEKYISERWISQEKRYRSAGRQSWLGEFIAWLLSTGWYSVFAMVEDNTFHSEVWAEVWSPADCFPGFGPDGLVEHAHIYKLSPAATIKKIKTMGWTHNKPVTVDTWFYDYWRFDTDGDVTNSIVIDTEFAKSPVKDVPCSKVGRLPIFTSPAGGLPDMGSIKTSKGWQNHYGESIVGTNEDLLLNYNKMRSFMQQAARTAAQPHWLELSSGETPIATETLMDRWGSVLHGQPGEDVRPLQGTPIPVELTNILFHYQNELQRGMFPWAVFGNVQQQMSYLAMANVASASMQILTPYKDAIQGMRTDVNNFWINMILENGFNPHNFKKPKNIPDKENRLFDVNADVEIPGYLVQRATVARMLNPEFRLPEAWLMGRLFPEIRNTLKSQADIRAEDAMMDPMAIMVDQILAYRSQAKLLEESGDVDSAALYGELADLKEAQLSIPQEQARQAATPTQSAAETAVAREAFPVREASSPIEGLGQTT